jgi:uncharacterized protein YndB with AHSA1/START domain
MSILTIVLLVIAAIVVIILIAALIISKHYTIQRSVRISAPAPKVFEYIRHIKNQDHYNKWVMTDPAMQKIFKGTDGTVGFVYGWNGNKKAGEGEQEIVAVNEGSEVVTEVRFVRPFPGLSRLQMITTPVSDSQTNVDFITSSRMPFPMNVMVPMVSKMLGRDMDVSLRNLKAIMER